MKFFLSITVLLFEMTFLKAQSLQNQLSNDKNWIVTTYNSLNGMPQNTVTDIVKDKNGMFWLSTQDGVVRFDGHRIKTFSTRTLKGFNQSRIRTFSFINDTIIVGGNSSNDSSLAYIVNNKLRGDENNHFIKKYFITRNAAFPRQYYQHILEEYSKSFFRHFIYI